MESWVGLCADEGPGNFGEGHFHVVYSRVSAASGDRVIHARRRSRNSSPLADRKHLFEEDFVRSRLSRVKKNAARLRRSVGAIRSSLRVVTVQGDDADPDSRDACITRTRNDGAIQRPSPRSLPKRLRSKLALPLASADSVATARWELAEDNTSLPLSGFALSRSENLQCNSGSPPVISAMRVKSSDWPVTSSLQRMVHTPTRGATAISADDNSPVLPSAAALMREFEAAAEATEVKIARMKSRAAGSMPVPTSADVASSEAALPRVTCGRDPAAVPDSKLYADQTRLCGVGEETSSSAAAPFGAVFGFPSAVTPGVLARLLALAGSAAAAAAAAAAAGTPTEAEHPWVRWLGRSEQVTAADGGGGFLVVVEPELGAILVVRAADGVVSDAVAASSASGVVCDAATRAVLVSARTGPWHGPFRVLAFCLGDDGRLRRWSTAWPAAAVSPETCGDVALAAGTSQAEPFLVAIAPAGCASAKGTDCAARLLVAPRLSSGEIAVLRLPLLRLAARGEPSQLRGLSLLHLAVRGATASASGASSVLVVTTVPLRSWQPASDASVTPMNNRPNDLLEGSQGASRLQSSAEGVIEVSSPWLTEAQSFTAPRLESR